MSPNIAKERGPLVRSARRGDAKLLAELAYKTFWDAFHDHPANRPEDMAAYMAAAFSEEQIARELADERNIYFIAELDGEPAGYAKLIVGATEQGINADRPIELARLYSHQKFLGKGVGQALMDACLSKARGLGCDVMWLGVWEHNPRAQRFYQRNGFSFCGTHIFQLGSDPQTDLLMRKELFTTENTESTEKTKAGGQ
jgi:GNAT superfamily N-acetyltransferase